MGATERRSSVWLVAVLATLGMTVSYVDRQTLAAIAPSVTKALSIDNTHYGWLLSGFSLAYLAFAPVAGALVDRLGARRGFALSVLVWSLVAAAHALVGGFASLLVLRVLLGTAEAPSFPAAAQAVRRVLPRERQPLAFGLLFTGSSLGAIIAGQLAVRLDTTFGFRGAFLGTALIGALWLPAWLFVTRGHGLERPAAAAINVSPSPAPGSPGPERWLDFVRSPPVLRAVIAVIGSAPALMFVLNWTSKYLVDGWGIPKANIGSYLMVAPVLFDLGSVGFGAIASRRQMRTPASGTHDHRDLVLVAMMLTSSVALVPLARNPLEAMVILGAAACGGGAVFALVTADMLARVKPERASSAGGMTAAAQSLSYVIAGPLVGWTVDRTHGYGTALVGIGLAIVPAGIAFFASPGMSSTTAER